MQKEIFRLEIKRLNSELDLINDIIKNSKIVDEYTLNLRFTKEALKINLNNQCQYFYGVRYD